MSAPSRKSGFPPVARADARLLVLGSLPGERSLAIRQYYGNPRNQFWRLMGEVIGVDIVPLVYNDRLEALADAGVALWDVVASATRPGSLDALIRDHEANDLLALTARLPGLRAVAFNGGKAAEIGHRILTPSTAFALVALPSSSPAYTLDFKAKREAWLALRAYLT